MRNTAALLFARSAPQVRSSDFTVTPAEYATIVALPTSKAALGARGDQRAVYLAAVATFHLVDYLARSTGSTQKAVSTEVRNICENEFDIVEGVCNGTKHAGPGRRARFHFSLGTDRSFRPFGFGPGHGGFGDGRWPTRVERFGTTPPGSSWTYACRRLCLRLGRRIRTS